MQRASNPSYQSGQQQKAWGMGWSLQNRQCWQSAQSCRLLLRCNKGDYSFIYFIIINGFVLFNSLDLMMIIWGSLYWVEPKYIKIHAEHCLSDIKHSFLLIFLVRASMLNQISMIHRTLVKRLPPRMCSWNTWKEILYTKQLLIKYQTPQISNSFHFLVSLYLSILGLFTYSIVNTKSFPRFHYLRTNVLVVYPVLHLTFSVEGYEKNLEMKLKFFSIL